MISLVTAGESHGPAITAILAGVPAGLRIDLARVDRELARRQGGYGRGARQEIERDRVEVLAGVRKGLTTGAPLALFVRNRDSRLDELGELYAPRPGHADLAGHQATGAPIRDVLERASARETAARVAAGAVAKQLLESFGIGLASHVTAIGRVVSAERPFAGAPGSKAAAEDPVLRMRALNELADSSPVRCLSAEHSAAMCRAIDEARERGESLGGVFEVIAEGVPAGLGSYAEPARRLDALLAGAIMSIPAIKGVEIGEGFGAAGLPGGEVHDEILWDPASPVRAGGFVRRTNRAGGIEGGVTNGMPVVVRAAMKPIPTLGRPLASADIRTHEPVPASKERSDVCAVPAASIVGEAMVALVLAGSLLERLGSGHIDELRARFDLMLSRLRAEPGS